MALFIFIFELLAPVVWISNECNSAKEERTIQFNQKNDSLHNLFASLVCEEAGSEEEREGKQHKAFFDFTEVNFGAVFQCLIRQESSNWPKDFYTSVRSGRSLLPSLSTFRI